MNKAQNKRSLTNNFSDYQTEYPLPQTGFLRLHQIIGNPKAKPPIPALIPVGKSTWWEGCRSGRFPQPIKIGNRITVWRVQDIKDYIEQQESL
jgi:prophage regulatory protein